MSRSGCRHIQARRSARDRPPPDRCRKNGRAARARDVKILFEDSATGARSPALVRQGQIGEIINAKPEQRRRVLEDAAGIAGLHSRRHEAELRLRSAENNLARLGDRYFVNDPDSTSIRAIASDRRTVRYARDVWRFSGQFY